MKSFEGIKVSNGERISSKWRSCFFAVTKSGSVDNFMLDGLILQKKLSEGTKK